jgi:hypothetical protein
MHVPSIFEIEDLYLIEPLDFRFPHPPGVHFRKDLLIARPQRRLSNSRMYFLCHPSLGAFKDLGLPGAAYQCHTELIKETY